MDEARVSTATRSRPSAPSAGPEAERREANGFARERLAGPGPAGGWGRAGRKWKVSPELRQASQTRTGRGREAADGLVAGSMCFTPVEQREQTTRPHWRQW
jgi:hypothetical protein